MILTTFFTLLSDPSKWVWPRLAKNLNCKYNYLIPGIQLSRKNWVGRSLGLNKWGLRRKIARFFEFRHLMSHRGKGVPYIGKFCIPNNSLWFVLSFKPLNGVLAPPSCEKTQFFFQNFQLQTPLTRKILLTQRNDLYRRVPLVEYYQNPQTRVHLFFWINTHPHPRVSGSVHHID